MTYDLVDTIAAIASPRGPGAVGIVRLDGPDVPRIVDRLWRDSAGERPPAITSVPLVQSGQLVLPGLSPIPCELHTWPRGRGYTGGTTAELHAMGSPPLLEATLEAVLAEGARLAEPGEFTLRAFLAGRLDLTRAEAVLGVIDAKDRRHLDVALDQLAGGLGGQLEALRQELLDLLADLEAGLDFADEPIDDIAPEELASQLQRIGTIVTDLASQTASRRDANVDIARVVLVGRPNTGKSSLFNALTKHDDALVSREPGTTRDYLTAEVTRDDVRWLLVDTAGTPDDSLVATLEHASLQAAESQRNAAVVELFCLDMTRPVDGWERDELARERGNRLIVTTKNDLPTEFMPPADAVSTSSRTGEGLDVLGDRIARAVLEANAVGGPFVACTAVRCHESLRLAGESLRRAEEALAWGEELVAGELRLALEELGKTVGAVHTEDLLDRIFSRFCVGK